MAEPIPDVIIVVHEPAPRIVYPTAAELMTLPNHLLPTITDEDIAGMSPEQLAAIERGLESAEAAGFIGPAQSTPRDDMSEVWRDIMGEELGGEG